MGVLLEVVKLIYDKIDKDRQSICIDIDDDNEREIYLKKIIDKERINKIKSINL